jgi:hypothetical protein
MPCSSTRSTLATNAPSVRVMEARIVRFAQGKNASYPTRIATARRRTSSSGHDCASGVREYTRRAAGAALASPGAIAVSATPHMAPTVFARPEDTRQPYTADRPD